MSERNDGGPAFPVFPASSVGHAAAFRGMTLRDFFAAAALQGFMANKSRPEWFQPEQDAQYLYKIADAMLAEREPK